MPRVVFGLLTVGVTIYTLVDVARSRADEVRGLPRAAWALVALLIPLFGGVAYVIYGRPRAPVAAGRAIAPDDDPDFLRSLDLRRRPGRGRKNDGPKNDGDGEDPESGPTPA